MKTVCCRTSVCEAGKHGIGYDLYARFCGYCARAKALLESKGVDYAEYNATTTPEYRQEMIEKSGGTTFPQIFINGQHVGGCDDLHALDRAGKLDPMLSN